MMQALSDPSAEAAAGPPPGPPRLRWLLLWMLLALQLPALLLFGVAAWLAIDREQVETGQRLMTRTVALSHRVNAHVVHVQGALQRLAQQLPAEGQDLRDFQRAATALASDLEVDAIVLVRANGQALLSSPPPAGAEPPRTAPPAFAEVARMARTGVVDVTSWPGRDTPVVGIGVPVIRANGEVLALQAVIELSRLYPLIEAPLLPARWQAAIVDNSGRYLVRGPAEPAPAGERIGLALQDRLAREGYGSFRIDDADGAPWAVSYWTSPATHWTAVVSMPAETFNAPTRQSLLLLGVPMGLVIAAGLAGAWLVRRRLTAALNGMRTATEAAETGRLRGEQRLEGMLQAAPIATLLIDETNRVRAFNPAARALFGHTPEQILGRGLEPLFTPLSWRDCQGEIAKVLSGTVRGPDGVVSGHCVRLGGDVFAAEFSVALIPRADGERLLSVTVRDVTEREQFQASLLAAHQEVQEVSQRFERMLLREMDARQDQIGRELHDAVGSAVAGVSLLLEAAAARRNDPALVGALLEKSREQVQLVAERLRQLSRGIVPAGSEAGALQQALEQYLLDAAALMGIECTLRARGDFSDVRAESAGHVYRVVQEAVTNAVRHGQARRITVHLARAGALCGLTVRDDGKGCDLSLVHPSHPGMGLKSMQARARALQGRLALRNRRSGGCEVVLRWSEPPDEL
ncbi:PAS domain S-box protein [Hydrogenophaga sp. SNF1]|uniref:PAS domain S-box protein n=1 Tax=Hydrogenophaga sp. SNF1 TaxID=3098762 RepID=UPI002ACC3394|nr:PAS domain S-box protein [Hydrogenophaga sp. SNF1]WQB84349.1 PAS domain S-box protein [Hydrogenophaga sp. SNF1]